MKPVANNFCSNVFCIVLGAGNIHTRPTTPLTYRERGRNPRDTEGKLGCPRGREKPAAKLGELADAASTRFIGKAEKVRREKM